MKNPGERLRIFISYARSDASALAEDLLASLEVAGFEAFLDRHDIAAGEVWEARLADLLQKADTVVAILSPAFVASPRCEWELKRAAELAKRVIPVIGVDVAEAATPDALKRLNYIYFSSGHAFGPSLRTLVTALQTDVEWIREHTRLGELAARWRGRSDADALLVRGSELEGAKVWLATWRPGAPEATEIHRAYINASEAAEAARNSEEQKRLEAIAMAQADREKALRRMRAGNRAWAIGLGVMAFLMLAGGGYAWVQIDGRNQKLDNAERTIKAQEEKNAVMEASLKQLDAKFAVLGQKFADASNETAVDGQISAQTSAALLAASRETDAAAERVQKAGGTVKASLTMSIDVFTCTGAGQSENSVDAKVVAKRLRAEQAAPSGGLPFQIGRIREREWTNKIELGGFIVADEVRGDPDEEALVDTLVGFLNAASPPTVNKRLTTGKSPTPYYLSVFLCSGQA